MRKKSLFTPEKGWLEEAKYNFHYQVVCESAIKRLLDGTSHHIDEFNVYN